MTPALLAVLAGAAVGATFGLVVVRWWWRS